MMSQRRIDRFFRYTSAIGAVLIGVSALIVGVSIRPIFLDQLSPQPSSPQPTLLNPVLYEWIALLTAAAALSVVGWVLLRAVGWRTAGLLPNRLRKAASQNAKALRLRDLEGDPRNAARAFKLFEAAAESGDVRAQLNLGCLYGTGRGVHKDEIMCYAWWSLAARAGSSRARRGCAVLDQRLSSEDITVAKDLSQKLRILVNSARPDFRTTFL